MNPTAQKVIFFDLDGTLTPDSTWLLLNQKLGITPEEDKALFEQYLTDTFAYNDWIKELVALYQSRTPVTRREIIELAETTHLRPDAVATVLALREKGYRVILLSGSVDGIVGTIATALGIDEWFACSTLVFDENDMLVGIESMGDEAPAKLAIVQSYIATNSIDIENCFAIDDGGNGIELFKVMKGILLGGNEKLKPLAWKQVETLSEISTIL
jgi:HAD superfamily phosphoserine phosphatase-like hydrolase